MLKMLEDGVKHNNDVARLEKIDKRLDKEKPNIEGKGGCYKLVVDGMDVVVFR